MIWLYIVLGVIGGVILISFIFAIVLHSMYFGKRFTPDPLVTYYSNSEFNIDRIAVEIPCRRETLRGYLYNPNGSIKDKLIVFNHGMGSSIDAYNQDICYFAARGYMVLGVNHIGVDTSSGRGVKGFSGSLKSLDYVLRWVDKSGLGKGKKIIVIGHSWGGFAASNITKYHPEVSKVIAISPFVSIRRMLKSSLPPFLNFLIPYIYLIDYFKCGKYAFCNSRKSLNSFNGSTLIVASRNDFMIKYDLNAGYLHHSVYGARYLINDDRYHNPNYTKDAVNYMIDYMTRLNAYKGNLEAINNLKKNTDFHRMGALDFEVMDKILKFIEE